MECNVACSLNPELLLLLDPSLIPDPFLIVFQEKGAPDDSCLPFYTVHEAQDDVHSGRKISTLTNLRHMRATL